MQSYNLNPEHIMTEVYSYPFPEVRDHLRSTSKLDPDFMLNTLDVPQAAGLLASYKLKPVLELPAHPDGTLNLDELHVPVIERIRRTVGEQLTGLETFNYAYPTPGSSQAMMNLMAEWAARGEMKSIAVLKGEYEGYAAYAEALGIPVKEYNSLVGNYPEDGEMWFVSNPSAVDGNWLPQEEWKDFLDAGHQVVYDAAYVGLTDLRELDVSAPNIRAILTSPSKIFGVFRYRLTGVAYTREPVACLYGSKWFKDVPALLDTLSLYETFGANQLPEKYRRAQEFICNQLVEVIGATVTPSDVLLLANTKGPVSKPYEKYRRADNYRFGLTKLFEDYERSAQK